MDLFCIGRGIFKLKLFLNKRRVLDAFLSVTAAFPHSRHVRRKEPNRREMCHASLLPLICLFSPSQRVGQSSWGRNHPFLPIWQKNKNRKNGTDALRNLGPFVICVFRDISHSFLPNSFGTIEISECFLSKGNSRLPYRCELNSVASDVVVHYFEWTSGRISSLDVAVVSLLSAERITTSFQLLLPSFKYTGIAGTFVGHPIDTIKVRQQTYPHGRLTTRRCIQLALKNEGVSSGNHK